MGEKLKQCKTCGLWLRLDDFSISYRGIHGVRKHCKKCCSLKKKKSIRNSQYKIKYGITLDDYNKMFEEQHGCCALCGRHQSTLRKNLSVDHNHKTGKVRALLCSACNTEVGKIDGRLNFILKVCDYIQG